MRSPASADRVRRFMERLGAGVRERDLRDVEQMTQRRLIESGRLVELFECIRPSLIRFPSLDEKRFEGNVQRYKEAHA